MGDSHTGKRQRVSKACEQCRRKKIKCDGAYPACGNCQVLQLSCEYKASTKKRGPPKGYIEAIEGRLHRLEALLGSVIQEDDPRAQAIFAEINAPLETANGELVRPRLGRSSEDEDHYSGTSSIPLQSPTGSSVQAPPPAFRQTLPQPQQQQQTQSIAPTVVPPDNGNDSCGNLSVDESGQLRYYGKSSGFYMLQKSRNFQNGTFRFNAKGHHSRDPKLAINPSIIDALEMPPDDLSDHLLDLYFRYFYPFLPLFHKRSFLESMKDDTSRPPPLLLNAVYAVASRISSDPRVRTDPAYPDTAGDIFFERARILLDYEWDDFKVSTVQSLLLLSSHQNGALKSIRGWLYSGLAFRMAQNLGLNRNCDNWNLTPVEKEERKRVFYCCFIVDRLSSAMHGRSPVINDQDYDTPYPSEYEENDGDETHRILENFQALIQLCELLGNVLGDLYTVKGRQRMAHLASPDHYISRLDKRLNTWLSKLSPALQYRPPNSRMGERAPAPSLELCQIHMLFYTTLILVHRPFIPGPSQSSPSAFPAASICTYAANKILDIVESLLNEGRLTRVNNYALFFMFTAGIIFINDASSTDSMFALDSKIGINKIIRAMDEVEKTWITSARHCNILAELAGLRDIDLENADDRAGRVSAVPMRSEPSIAVPNSPDLRAAREWAQDNHPTATTQAQMDSLADRDAMPLAFSSAAALGMPTPFTYALPVPFPATESMPDSQRPADAFGSAFWGVPTSFDIDEWTSYFTHQNHQPQLLS